MAHCKRDTFVFSTLHLNRLWSLLYLEIEFERNFLQRCKFKFVCRLIMIVLDRNRVSLVLVNHIVSQVN